jgi:hypothetical protein
MKTEYQIAVMLQRIEALVPAGDRGAAIMALEWVINGPISTSVGLETWIEAYAEDSDGE